MGEEHSKCLRPEPGALIISEYSVSIGQRGNYFFDFDCGNLFYESQVCDKILSTFRFLK
ncbi:MAG: hypothetical protein HYT36_01025 [Candidatus Staskawiczbacteria bacterium]|nr:hypothetical protein [Candidatus Staskawiczbacteria bacterium]